jgi:hypothetical protein
MVNQNKKDYGRAEQALVAKDSFSATVRRINGRTRRLLAIVAPGLSPI